jgi:serine/threonine protein kinase
VGSARCTRRSSGDPDRKVAIKVLRLGLDSPEDVREILARFAAERQALALLNHPGIAKVFGSGATESGQPYFVMEFVDGLRIVEFCEKRRLDLRAGLWSCHVVPSHTTASPSSRSSTR